MIFRQITHDDLGCASYLIGDEDAGVAAVVDPKLEIEEYLALGRRRASIALQAEAALAHNPDRRRLMTVPGVGPITALTILAEAGDLRRFAHYRQFLKFCGMNLSTQHSDRFRGVSWLSKKYGNARLDVPISPGNQRGPRTRENRAGSFCAPVNGPIGPMDMNDHRLHGGQSWPID